MASIRFIAHGIAHLESSVTAAPTTQRFARATDATVRRLGGPSAWSGRSVVVPALDALVAQRLAAALAELGAEASEDAPLSPTASPTSRVVDAVELAAWVQAVLTTTGRATNLGFAQASVLVHGAGPRGTLLARRLRDLGARVRLRSSDRIALVVAATSGLEIETSDIVPDHLLFVIATGEDGTFEASSIGAGHGSVVVVDAAPPGAPPAVAFTAIADEVRPDLLPVVTSGRDAVVLRIEDTRDQEYDRAVADVRAAFVLLLVADADASAAAADRALAELVLP
ncbi:MAG: hypothetical protein ABWZ77_06495 [Naasia sp.]